LHIANSQVAGNYCGELRKGYRDQMNRLYQDKDASFRGFRHV
jgi:hypothetical protein